MILLEAHGVSRHYRARGGRAIVRALDGIDLTVMRSETLGVVGESGCGKSTLGRVLSGLEPPSAGRILYDGAPLPQGDGPDFRATRRLIQFVYQHPLMALNPRLSVGAQVAELARVHGLAGSAADARHKTDAALTDVGLDTALGERYPHQLSGGQRQRALLARSLVVDPEFVVLDEPTSALDLSVQAQVIELLGRLKAERALTVVIISHDLRVVRVLSDRIAVMYLGVVVEIGTATQVYHAPAHPYAIALLAALLRLDPDAPRPVPLDGEPANGADVPPGCRFHPRCPRAASPCRTHEPRLMPLPDGRRVACHAVAADIAGTPWPDRRERAA